MKTVYNRIEERRNGTLSGPPGESTTPSTATTAALTRRQLLLRGAAATSALSVGGLAYETTALTVTHHTLRMPGLKQPCRVVQLTDLHRSWSVPEHFIAQVIARTNALRPDVVALTGDFVTRHSDYIESCASMLHALRAPQGMFAVLGNHDNNSDNWHGARPIIDGLTTVGVQVLTNESIRLDNGLRLVGIEDFTTSKPDPAAAFRHVEKRDAVLVLTHNPLLFQSLCLYDCVTLAGHTHGGQINVPGLTSLLLGHRRYQQGWYREPIGPGRLYVSRGIGVVGVPFRFCAPPEIAVFDLTPA